MRLQGAALSSYLLLLENVCVLPQAQVAEELRQVRALQRRVQAAAVAATQRGDAVHVVAATQVMLCSCHGSAHKNTGENTHTHTDEAMHWD